MSTSHFFSRPALKCKNCGYSWQTKGYNIPSYCPNCGEQIYGTKNYRNLSNEDRLVALGFILYFVLSFAFLPFFNWIIKAFSENIIVAIIVIAIVFFASVVGYRKIVLLDFKSKYANNLHNLFIRYFWLLLLFVIFILFFILVFLIPNQEAKVSGAMAAALYLFLVILIVILYFLYRVGKIIHRFLKPDVRKERY